MKIAAFTQGRAVPSARYRVRQNIPYLARRGIEVTEFFPKCVLPPSFQSWPGILRKPLGLALLPGTFAERLSHALSSYMFQIAWLQREMIPGFLSMEKFVRIPFALDVDDAIWLTNKGLAKDNCFLVKEASIIIAGNNYLADWFSKYNPRVSVVPTGVDTTKFVPLRKTTPQLRPRRFTVGWIGTSGNLVYLYEIQKALGNFLKRYTDTRLLVVSNTMPSFDSLPSEKVHFVQWSEDMEVEAIQSMDVGIMPLADDEWTRGKCSFKMLQYMACGIPVVASPVGMNRDVLSMKEVGLGPKSQDDWTDALDFLFKNRELAQKLGQNGRALVIERFDSRVISKKLAQLFASLIE